MNPTTARSASKPCSVCFRHCHPAEGELGFCRARRMKNGRMTAENYGRITSLALDPIEKKPLARFYPGSRILSVGSYGCSMNCAFCQNWEIAGAGPEDVPSTFVSPADLVDLAVQAQNKGNIGVAFTYNEPLVSWEYIRDTGELLHEAGLKTVVVTNGMADLSVLREIAPYVDAMNIDLKSFRPDFYRRLLDADLDMVKTFIAEAVKLCHVEITTLIVPNENDSPEEIRELSAWIAGLDAAPRFYGDPSTHGGKYSAPLHPMALRAKKAGAGAGIPLHITRFFPRRDMRGKAATPVNTIYRLCDIARQNLNYVYPGNV